MALTHPHAGDPARWLVVYNTAHADGHTWATFYRDLRGVPSGNLCGLALPLTETIDASAYLSLRDAVLAYLSANALTEQVLGVLLGLGVPGYVDFADQGDAVPVASLLHTDASDDAVSVNPLHRDPPIARPTAGAMGGVRFTGRIDGASLAEAKAFSERATALMQQPPTATGGTLWLDPVPEDDSVNPLFTTPMLDWADGMGPGTLRVPVSRPDDGVFTTIDNDLAFWGWGQSSPPTNFFGDTAGRRAVYVQLATADPPVTSARDASATHWLRRATDAGYASAAASSRAYTLSALPQPGVFFETLRLGWTLAEAWCVCQPFLRSGMQMLGDPLMTLVFPKSGFDVFGPAQHLELIDPNLPAVRLPATADALALSTELVPNEGQAAHYLVRRVDEAGRSDGGSSSTYAQPLGDRVVTPPPLPAWPEAEGWRVPVANGNVRAVAVWPVAPAKRGPERVVLDVELDSTEIETLWEGVPLVGQRWFAVSIAWPSDALRLRWRVVGDAGSERTTPWSAPLAESAVVDSPLTIVEVPV